MDSMDFGSTKATLANAVVVGEKRSVDDRGTGGKEDEDSVIETKKTRNGGFESDKEMQRIAEMVLVLSAMVNMRAGREPTAAEKDIMSEARTKIVAVCERLAPQDILPKEAFGSVIQDLGINRLRDRRLATGPRKCSIFQKMDLAQRKMAEPKAFSTPQQAVFPSQKLQTGMGTSVESCGTMANACVFTTDKSGHIPVSVGNFRAIAPNVSSAGSEPLSSQPSTHEIQLAATSSTGVSSNNVKRDSPSAFAPRIIHFGSDGRTTGPSYIPYVPVLSVGDQNAIRTAAPHLQRQHRALANAMTKNKVPEHLMVKPDGNANLTAPEQTPLISHVHTANPVQATTGTVVSMPYPIPDRHFAHTAPTSNHHLEIFTMVQKLLLPKPPEHPTWTVPSRDYMNKTLTCQTCKLSMNEVESLLVCDACEKGSHLRCLRISNQKSIPRGEWHCLRCLNISHGKSYPTKYGRVTRNVDAPKVPCNTAGVQPSLGKKLGLASEQVNRQTVVADRRSNEENASHTSAVTESSSESKMAYVSALHENDVCFSVKKDVRPKLESCPNNEDIKIGAACTSLSAGSLSDEPTPQAPMSESLPRIDMLVDNSQSSVKPLSVTDASYDVSQSSKLNDNDQAGFFNGIGAPSGQYDNTKGNINVKDLYKFDMRGAAECNSNIVVKLHNQGDAQENHLQTSAVNSEPVLAVDSENSLRNVDWTGDVDRIVDEKKYYQSCFIDGVGYRVLDYVLFLSADGKLTPSKIQAMWEDNQTGLKWVIVRLCYFPGDLPEGVAHPCAPDSNEVYESNCESTLRAGLIEGPCDIYSPKNFGEENKIVDRVAIPGDRERPIFICRWFYDEIKRVFRPIPA